MDRTAAALTLPRALALLMLASVVPLIGHIPWWILLTVGALVGWRTVAIDWLPLPSRAVKWLVAVLAASAIYVRFHTFIGERPGIAFFMLLYGLKLLETDSRRDLVVLALLSYIGLLGGMLYDPGIGMGVFSAGFLVLSFAALAGIVSPRVAARKRLRQALVLLLQALPVAIVLYVVFPRVTGGFFGQQKEAVGQTGVSPILRPGSLSDLVPSRKVAMRVLFRGAVPPPDARYFRVYALSVTNGREWRTGEAFAPGVTRGHPRIRYTILLNPSGHRALPALDWPVGAPPPDRLGGGATLSAPRPVRALVRYRLVSAPRRLATLSARERAANLELPTRTEPRVIALAHRLAAGDGGAQGIAARVLHYFVSHHFVYTLTPPPMGAHPVAHFLFTVRAGYCEDYAAAFATLMRAARVPTRVIVGYAGGQYNPDGGDVIVRERDAHAWDECWIRGRWRRFDPTAVVAPGIIRYGVGAFSRGLAGSARGRGRDLPAALWTQALRFAQAWRDAAITGWDNWIVSYDGRRQEDLLARLGWDDPGRATLALVVLGVLAALAYGVRLYGVRPRRSADPALALYQRYQARLARAGLPARAGEGPATFGRRVGRARPDLAPAVLRITDLYVAVRYGGETNLLPALRQAVWRFFPRGPRT
ncbi:MAG: DUF3488 and transglutaminase-like domain-containing protein [Gammaproteobacteria bacterium]|nr:DUF3488 and transglutaminase-like domain-containing protein [Gammaproteobacteria bacterium]